MEIELKYHIDDEKQAEAIFTDPEILEITDEKSDETIIMKAAYFDTEERRLSREGMTFRVRREGERIVGTLKWNGKSDNGMHVREEVNVPVTDENKLLSPDIEIFKKTPIYDELRQLIGKRELFKVIGVDVVRRQVRVDTGASICEISYDSGKVYAGNKEGIISEMEIELYSGDREDMEKLGNRISEKYNIRQENRSKFRQGLELMEE